jgi:exopolyphosphatase / guanosine-5'-triphosphate,3'-diphosphate pyrophosphatase
MMNTIASIDLGSHTARLLIARVEDGCGTIEPLLRKRSYLYLAKDFDPVLKEISTEASARAITVLRDFSRAIKDWQAQHVVAVATGVVRKAVNRDLFLKAVFEETGLRVTVITGEEEALLTGKGALRALGIKKPPFFVFDLGGGTTEFFCHCEEGRWVNSVSLGAMMLTNAFLAVDPPTQKEMKALVEHIDETLDRKCLPFALNGPVIGTGGTVAALCALQNGISQHAIVPERINGLALGLFEVESSLEKMRRLTTAQRIERLGLDSGRARVLVAGSAVVARLLRYLKVNELQVSMSDLLEGAVMEFLEGERHG